MRQGRGGQRSKKCKYKLGILSINFSEYLHTHIYLYILYIYSIRVIND